MREDGGLTFGDTVLVLIHVESVGRLIEQDVLRLMHQSLAKATLVRSHVRESRPTRRSAKLSYRDIDSSAARGP